MFFCSFCNRMNSLLSNFDLVSFLTSRTTIIVVGLLGFILAAIMFMNCACCSGGKCSTGAHSSAKKSMKKHAARAVSSDSKRNSSTSSIRKSPRKSKLN